MAVAKKAASKKKKTQKSNTTKKARLKVLSMDERLEALQSRLVKVADDLSTLAFECDNLSVDVAELVRDARGGSGSNADPWGNADPWTNTSDW